MCIETNMYTVFHWIIIHTDTVIYYLVAVTYYLIIFMFCFGFSFFQINFVTLHTLVKCKLTSIANMRSDLTDADIH